MIVVTWNVSIVEMSSWMVIPNMKAFILKKMEKIFVTYMCMVLYKYFKYKLCLVHLN